jgi:hypothetical protein
MRCAGRIDPGNGGAVFTGQPVLFIPSLTAFTSSRLSLFVRPFTVGTVIGGSFAAESLPVVDGVLDAPRAEPVLAVAEVSAPPPLATCVRDVDELAASAADSESPSGDGCASLVAAHPLSAAIVRAATIETRAVLSDTNAGISVGIDE